MQNISQAISHRIKHSSSEPIEYNGIKYIFTFPEKETTEEEWQELGQEIYRIIRPL